MSRQIPNQLMQLSYPQHVAEFPTYEDAQAAVDLVHTLHALSSVMLHYMLVPTQVCRPSFLCISSICIPLFRLK